MDALLRKEDAPLRGVASLSHLDPPGDTPPHTDEIEELFDAVRNASTSEIERQLRTVDSSNTFLVLILSLPFKLTCCLFCSTEPTRAANLVDSQAYSSKGAAGQAKRRLCVDQVGIYHF